MAATINDYLDELHTQKDSLVAILTALGVDADSEEKFNTLVPKVKQCMCPYVYEENTKTLTLILNEV